jgi:hypothetical protein
MACSAWANSLINLKKRLQPSHYRSSVGSQLLIMMIFRVRREHRVFTKLLQMIPNFEDRLMNSSEEEVTFIADLVRL